MPYLLPNGELEKKVDDSRNHPDFLSGYLRFVSIQEGSPKIHLWSAISILAGALERRVYLKRGHFNLYPNLYIFIVGKSGVVRKSTSTGLAVQFLKRLPNVKILSDRVTAASLIDQLVSSKKTYAISDEEQKEQAPLYIYAPELIVLMREVFGSIVELLTSFWDSPETWENKTKNSGNSILKGVCVNMLAATTPEWLRESVSQQVMAAGFAGRIVFVCVKDRSKPIAWPKAAANADEMRDKLFEDLLKIYELHGEMVPTKEAYEFFEEWYTHFMPNVADLNEDSRMDGYYGRVGDMILKIAMVRSVSKSSKLVLEKEHIEWAVHKLAEIEEDLTTVYPNAHEYSSNHVEYKILEIAYKAFHSPIQIIKEEVLRKNIYDLHLGISDLKFKRALNELLNKENLKMVNKIVGKNNIYVFNESVPNPFNFSEKK